MWLQPIATASSAADRGSRDRIPTARRSPWFAAHEASTVTTISVFGTRLLDLARVQTAGRVDVDAPRRSSRSRGATTARRSDHRSAMHSATSWPATSSTTNVVSNMVHHVHRRLARHPDIPRPRRETRSRVRLPCFFRSGPSAARYSLHERGTRLGVGEAHLGLHGRAGNLLAVERGPVQQRGAVLLDALTQPHEVLERHLIAQRDRAPVIGPRNAGRHDERGRDRLVQRLDQVAPAPLTGRPHEPRPFELLEVVVHVLAWQPERVGDAGRRVGLAQRSEDPDPQTGASGLNGVGIGQERHTRGHPCIIDDTYCRDKQFFRFTPRGGQPGVTVSTARQHHHATIER